MARAGRIEIREILIHLGIEDHDVLDRLREEGMFEKDDLDVGEAHELRVAAVMMEELGVNPAGVQVALHLRRRLLTLEARVTNIMDQMQEREG
jgi:hypothetical protein